MDTSTQEAPEFSVGDQVTWTHCVRRGRSLGFSTRTGKITKIFGAYASLKMRNGRTDQIRLAELRKDGQKTALTELFEDMAG